MYPKSIYKDESSLVVWSPETHAARTLEGWSDNKPLAAAAAPIPDPDADPDSTSDADTASGISKPDNEAPELTKVQKPKAKSAKKG